MAHKNEILLQDILNDLLDVGKSLTGAVMKVKYFALRTKNSALEKFASRELEGYMNVRFDEIPEYRKGLAKIFLDISVLGQEKRIETTSDILENPEHRAAFKYAVFREGISAIEKMETNLIVNRKQEPYIATPLPIQVNPYFEEGLAKQNSFPIRVHGGKLATNPYRVHEIIPAVRSRLISFVSDLADKFGFEIDLVKFNEDQVHNNQTVYKIMYHTEITGDGNVYNSGDNTNITSKISIVKNDIQSLIRVMGENGIDKADIDELASIVEQEKPERGSLGPKVVDWILNISGKALKGVGKIATGVSSNLLATLIKAYYGIGE